MNEAKYDPDKFMNELFRLLSSNPNFRVTIPRLKSSLDQLDKPIDLSKPQPERKSDAALVRAIGRMKRAPGE